MSSVRKVRLDSSVKRAKQDRTPHVRRPCPRQPFTMTQAADFVESHPLGTREKSESGAKTRCTEQNRCCSTLCQSRGRRASEGQSSAKQRRKRNHGTRGSRALVILSHSTQSAFPHLPRHSEVASSLVIRQCPPPTGSQGARRENKTHKLPLPYGNLQDAPHKHLPPKPSFGRVKNGGPGDKQLEGCCLRQNGPLEELTS